MYMSILIDGGVSVCVFVCLCVCLWLHWPPLPHHTHPFTHLSVYMMFLCALSIFISNLSTIIPLLSLSLATPLPRCSILYLIFIVCVISSLPGFLILFYKICVYIHPSLSHPSLLPPLLPSPFLVFYGSLDTILIISTSLSLSLFM